MSIWIGTGTCLFSKASKQSIILALLLLLDTLDDILIFSPDMETHLKHLRVLFERLRSADLN